MSVEFEHLPDGARLWIFGVSRPLADDEVERLLGAVDAFLDGWKAHGHPLAAARRWQDDRFLMVAVDDRVAVPSGCSIDALIRILRGLEEELGIQLVGSAPLWYRDRESGAPERIERPAFRAAASAGLITDQTRVFDLTLTRVGELREGKWERPVAESWHREFLKTR